ncbi:MAG: hypothetical protein EXR36_04500 [Betaproteobacteria bacterium]|nr:hypothetical protein [Betaproteobacteria bacterium]
MNYRLIAMASAISLCFPLTGNAQDAEPRPNPAVTNTVRTGASAFNPAISLILDGKYRYLSKDPATWQLGGFIPGGEETGPGERGFGIGESELTLSANIDPYFSGYVAVALSPDEQVSVEEAHIQNAGALPGLTIKFGRFFTSLGYQNEQHAHAWDFSDLPLLHQAFFGGQYSDDGIQVRYLAPTLLFLEIGIEGGRGSGFPGSDQRKNGGNGAGAFVHIGGDVGVGHSYRAGLSFRQVRAKDRAYRDTDSAGTAVTNAFSGKSKLWGADFVWKWAPNGDPSAHNFKFQAEYFQRKESGDLAFDTLNAGRGASYESKQSGWNAQAVYQFMPRWRVGARYDQLDSGEVAIGMVNNGTLSAADFPVLAAHDPRRVSLMADFSPSEFSRLRLQFARDQSRFGETDNQIVLQYIMSLGAHGAHKF